MIRITILLSLGINHKILRTILSVVKHRGKAVEKTIQNTVGITVMPNGGDVFVRKFALENPGVLKAVNQEGVLYDDNSAQSAGDTRYLTEYLDWCKSQGMYIRGIEYINTEAGKLAAAEYYKNHGWNQLYVSPQRDLRGN